MVKVMEVIQKLRKNKRDNKYVLQTIEELRVRGWLEDGSLKGIPLIHVHMQDADLFKADLTRVDFHQADLRHANLSMANLMDVKFTRANLTGANFSEANLEGADFFKTNLTNACNLTDEQLLKAKRLFGSIMPDGDIYDGRYNLEGDLEFARWWGRAIVEDHQAMAYFYGVSLETYKRGQELKLMKKKAVANES